MRLTASSAIQRELLGETHMTPATTRRLRTNSTAMSAA